MAFEEIQDDVVSGQFFNFTQIGQSFVGVFVSKSVKNGKFGPKTNWTFDVNGENFIISAAYQLNQKLNKAALSPGDTIDITFTGTMALAGREKPMQQYRVLVDRTGTPVAASTQSGMDDIPF